MLLVAVEIRKFECTATESTPLVCASTFQTHYHRFSVSPSAPTCSGISSKVEEDLTFFKRSMFSNMPSSSFINCLFEACFSNFFSTFTKLGSYCLPIPIFLSLLTKFLIFWYLSCTTSHFLLVFSSSLLSCLLLLLSSWNFLSISLLSLSSILFRPADGVSGS
jgi:hypothetical protein